MTQYPAIKIFEEKKIRTSWDAESETWYYSIVDVVGILTSQPDTRHASNYWKVLKNRLSKEGCELVTNCNQLKMPGADGKNYKTDVADAELLLRIIQSIPSPKAEPFKQWLAQGGSEAMKKKSFSPTSPTCPTRPTKQSKNLIQSHGGYSNLVTYRLGTLIYDATAAFCAQYLSPKDRTYDQMVQAARSGVANVIEGSEASAASKKTELKLTNVAKASQEELLSDYQAFLRQHGLPVWSSESPEARMVRDGRPDTLDELRKIMAILVRSLSDVSDQSDLSDKKSGHERILQEVACNAMITLINQETYLLKRQIASLAADFERNGGFTERLYRVRSEYREKQTQADKAEKACKTTKSGKACKTTLSDKSDSSDKTNKTYGTAMLHGSFLLCETLTREEQSQNPTPKKHIYNNI